MEVLTIGPVHAITDNTIRALPARATTLLATFSTATSIDISNASDMSDPQNLVELDFADKGGLACAAGFIRVNGGNATVRLAAS